MSDDTDYSDAPTGKVAQIKYSITNLWDDLGRADDPKVGFFVSLILAASGVFVYAAFDEWVAFAGAVWAILNILGPIKWVLNL